MSAISEHRITRTIAALAIPAVGLGLLLTSPVSGSAHAIPDGPAHDHGARATHGGTHGGEASQSFAFVARADDAADALAASAQAGRLGAPVVLSHTTVLPEEAHDALVSIDPDVVILAGGTQALSDDVAQQVAAALPGAEVRRVAGPTRTHTAQALSALSGEYPPAWLPTAAAQDFAPAHDELVEVTLATAAYQDVNAAFDDGWDVLFQPDPDDVNSACFDQEGVGGMGIHFVNADLLDDQLDPTQPEALVYELTPDGPELVAVEYVVPADAWTQDDPPSVLGRDLHLNEALGLWALHAWVWKDNPAGMYEDFNPKVRMCPDELPKIPTS